MLNEKPVVIKPKIQTYGYKEDGVDPVFIVKCTLAHDQTVLEKRFYQWIDRSELIYAFDGYMIDEINILATVTRADQIAILVHFLNVHTQGFLIGGKERNEK